MTNQVTLADEDLHNLFDLGKVILADFLLRSLNDIILDSYVNKI